MTVALKSSPHAPAVFDRLAVHSVIGALYVLGSLAIVSYGIPQLWAKNLGPWLVEHVNSFVSGFLLVVALLGAAAGLIALGAHLVGSKAPHGMKAGVFFLSLTLLALAFVILSAGASLEASLTATFGASTGGAVLLGAAVVIVLAVAWAWTRPDAEAWLVTIEEQGWFGVAPYKESQGKRVRRGTFLALLVLGGCGVASLLTHKTLESGPANWTLAIPFTGGETLMILPNVSFTVPMLLTLGTLWLAYRVVNFPAFADFLIATEAEMNKVSWATFRRLWQDTVVVLVTVFFMAVFLFFIDILWGQALTYVGVLRLDSAAAHAKQDELKW